MAVIPTDCYRRNLAALGAVQPDVAAVVDGARIPAGVTPASGRDGSETFLIPSAAGEREWFGQSSMPRISAAGIFAGFCSDGSNVSLPGVLTGVEPLVVAGKMPTHAALFVVERDPLQIKLAMHLHDYEALLTAGRLVFLLDRGHDLSKHLQTFYERNSGYELPVQLLTAPQRSPVEIADLQQKLETAGAEVAAMQSRRVETCLKKLRDRKIGSLPAAPRVAVLGTDPTLASLEQVRRIERTLTALQWPHRICIPDSPSKCHTLARVETVDDSTADFVLFVNDIAGPVLPRHLPVASWFLPGAVVQHRPTRELGDHELVFASSRALHDQIARAGVPDEVIVRCEVSADDVAYHPAARSADNTNTKHADIAVIADLPDDRPEASGVNLPSHVVLWEFLQAAATHHVDNYHPDKADDLLDAAKRDSGTSLEDPDVRRHFADLIRARIAPAAVARSAVRTLIEGGYRIAVWGRNWPLPGESGYERHDAIPVGDALNRVFGAVRTVLLPLCTPLAIQTALDALAAGAQVICRQPDESFEREYPGLAELALHLPLYRTGGELLDLASVVASSGGGTDDPCGRARAIVRAEHTVAKRLQAIVDTLRRRQASRA